MHLRLLAVSAATLLHAAAAVAATGTYASVNGLDMYYEVHGNGATPILLLHNGTGTIDYSFATLIPMLARSRMVVAPEQQAHGRTKDVPERPLTYEQMAEDTAALLQQLHLAPVDIIGWSDGGNLALLLAIHHPQLVRKVLVTGANYRSDGVDAETLAWLRTVEAEEWPHDILDAQQKVGLDLAQFSASLPRFKSMWLNFAIPRNDLGSIQAQVLVMGGDGDMIRLEHLLDTFRAIPHARLAILPNTGHGTLLERPAWFADIAQAFFSESTPELH